MYMFRSKIPPWVVLFDAPRPNDRKQKLHMPQKTARNTEAIAKSCSYVVCTTTIFSTLGIPVSKRLWKLRYWKGMRNTSRSKTKSCKTCQVNKKRTSKYGHLPPKIIISTPWEALCVNLVGPYTLKGKDGTSTDFMALTMIDPASSWFEIVELSTIYRLITKKENGKERTIEEEIFDKSSDRISRLVNKIWLCRYPRCCYLIYDNKSEFKIYLKHYAIHTA